MASGFTFPQSVVFSSQFKRIDITSDASSVRLVLSLVGGVTLMDEVFFPFDGEVSVYEIDSLIESAFESMDMSFGRVTIALHDGTGSSTMNVYVIYCKRVPLGVVEAFDTPRWLRENFLTFATYRRIPWYVPVSAHAFVESGEDLSWRVQVKGFVKDSGEPFAVDYSVLQGEAPSRQIAKFSPSLSSVMSLCASRLSTVASNIIVSSVGISLGQRFICFYLDEGLQGNDVFFFRSAFNLPDFISMPGQVVADTTPSAASAFILGSTVQYDRKVEKSFSVTWPSVTPDDAFFIEDFLCSHYIERFITDFPFMPDVDLQSRPSSRIVISSAKVKVSAFDELSSVEFSYRFSQGGIVDPGLSFSLRFFDGNYNRSFS